MRGIRTRFRAYHLGSAGLSFSYFADGPFTMIEAWLTGESRDQVEREMTEKCSVDHAYVLHNGFTTKRFLNHIEPDVAICSSDYDNMYDHPRQEIRELLHEQGIHLKTTKTGDVIIRSTGDYTDGYEVINLIGRSTKESSRVEGLFSKKSGILDANGDTLRQRYGAKRSWPR